MKVIGIKKDGSMKELVFSCAEVEEKLYVSVKRKETVGESFEVVRIESELTTKKVGEDGYMFFPTKCLHGVVRCFFTEREDATYESDISIMSVCGIGGTKDAVCVIVKGCYADCRFRVSLSNGIYQICPEFQLDGDDAYEDISIEYIKMPNASYADIAKMYRKYQMEEKGCRPIKERIVENPSLAYACESLELRIRMGWKPPRTPVMHQTPETEPPMKVACDIKKMRRLIHEMKKQGVDKAEICLVGWGVGGHDGRFPQQYPSDERYGGDEELKAFIKEAQEMGYKVVCHTVSVEAYEIADNWDKDLLIYEEKDGMLVPKETPYVRSGGLSGGLPYYLCPKAAYEHYGVKDLPKVKEYGFSGLHYIDEVTNIKRQKCYHEEHPLNRAESGEYYRKLAKLSKELFGGFQSEGWFDYMNADVDFVLYTSFVHDVNHSVHPLFDEMIPFWQLVYHGIVLSNPSSETVNYTLKGSKEHLRFVEYGGRPLMYLYSKFGDEKNWMGDIDLVFESDEELEACVKAIKKAADEYEKMYHLQYEYIDNHEMIKDGVYCTSYSDGTQVIVDYNKGSYEIKGLK